MQRPNIYMAPSVKSAHPKRLSRPACTGEGRDETRETLILTR